MQRSANLLPPVGGTGLRSQESSAERFRSLAFGRRGEVCANRLGKSGSRKQDLPSSRVFAFSCDLQWQQLIVLAMDKVNLAEKFSHIKEYWKPYIAAELNGQHLKLDKLKGEFVFHHHEHEDEMFLVVKGRFRMEFRDRHEWIEEGEFIVVPRGVEHRPVADEECWLLLFEPAGTLNTGNVVNERTIKELERV
jgi:mannose-6-phosphate isomerase-like protein (cupin superfamily)